MKTLTRAELRAALTPRLPHDHKGTYGHVLVTAGSRGMAGAAILCAKAAMRSGTGLVTLALPASLQAGVAAAVPEVMTVGLPENAAGSVGPEAVAKLKAALKEKAYTVLVLGPGLSLHPDTARFIVSVLSGLELPTVVDADALSHLALQDRGSVREMLGRRKHPCVFTPHPGEMGRCLGIPTSEVQKDREAAVKRLARDWGGVAILKGHESLVSDGQRVVSNQTGGTGLAQGGSGDALAGLIAGLWAQRLASGRGEGAPAFSSAALAAWLHGTAGDITEKELGPQAMTIGDVIARLGPAFRSL